MLQQRGYERFGLTQNPFQDLTSDNAEGVPETHVDQDVDKFLRGVMEDVVDGRRKATIALIGPMGAGKTQRLRVAQAEAAASNVPAVYFQITHSAEQTLLGIADAIRRETEPGAFGKFMGGPKSHQELKTLKRRMKRGFDPEAVGRILAQALNEAAPCFLLLNDLQHLEASDEMDKFVKTLHAVQNEIRRGVMVLVTCYPQTFRRLEQQHPAVTTRFDRRLAVRGLDEREAALMLGKRFLQNRLVEDLDPLYPFTEPAVARITAAAASNPRRLLKIASRVLEQATAQRAYHVDVEQVEAVLEVLGGDGPRAPETEPGKGAVRAKPAGDAKRPAVRARAVARPKRD